MLGWGLRVAIRPPKQPIGTVTTAKTAETFKTAISYCAVLTVKTATFTVKTETLTNNPWAESNKQPP